MSFDFTPFLKKAKYCEDRSSGIWSLISDLAREKLGKTSVNRILEEYASLLKASIPSLTIDVNKQSDTLSAIENLLMALTTENDSTVYLIGSLNAFMSEEKLGETES